jgi:predicted O-methyltransferase YrrM
MRFERSSIPEVGRLLAALAAQRPRGRVAEIGTGCGVGAAWIASTLGVEASLVTVETDAERARAVDRLFADLPNVRVLHGDWHELLPAEAPFDLLFFDGGHWKRSDVMAESEQALALVTAGGAILVDDLTPGRHGPDAVRGFWLGDARLAATEILTTPQTAAIIAVRRAA